MRVSVYAPDFSPRADREEDAHEKRRDSERVRPDGRAMRSRLIIISASIKQYGRGNCTRATFPSSSGSTSALSLAGPSRASRERVNRPLSGRRSSLSPRDRPGPGEQGQRRSSRAGDSIKIVRKVCTLLARSRTRQGNSTKAPNARRGRARTQRPPARRAT